MTNPRLRALRHAVAAASLLAASSAVAQELYWTERGPSCVGTLLRHRTLGTDTTDDLISTSESMQRVVVDAASRHVYWSTGGYGTARIRRGSLDELQVVDVVTVPSPYSIKSFTVDPDGGKLLWGEDVGCSPCGGGGCPSCPRIRRADLDGANATTVYTFPNGSFVNLSAVALDAPAGKVYWADFQFAPFLSRANLDGSNVEPLLTDLAPLASAGISELAVDPTAEQIYWVEVVGIVPGASRIRRSSLAAFAPEPLVTYTPSQTIPRGLAVDGAGGRFYWTLSDFCPSGTGKIVRADLAASQVEELIPALGLTTSIAIVPAPTVPPGCVRATTFDSVACRLGEVGQAIVAGTEPGTLQTSLGARITSARTKVDQAQASCAQAKRRPAKRGLGRATGLVGSAMAKLRSRAGKGLDDGIRTALLDALQALRDDLRALGGGLACP